MLRELRIENLKAFGGFHRLSLAPLTLIYGANSAGKSTLIQSLLLLKQTLESSDPDRAELVVRGSLADLGSVPGIISGHQLDRPLEIGLTIDPARAFYTSGLGPGSRQFDFTFTWDSETQSVRQTKARLGIGGQDVASYTRRRGPAVAKTEEEAGRRDFPFRLGQKAAREQFVRWMLRNTRQAARLRTHPLVRDRDTLEQTVELLVDNVSFAAAPWSIVPVLPQFRIHKHDFKPEEAFVDLLETMQIYWRQRSNAFRAELMAAMESLVYLGPLRRAPARFQVISGSRRLSVGREGEFAAEILRRRKGDVLPRVNHWLKRLGIPYSIDALPLLDEELSTTIGDVVVLVLTDLRSGLKVSPGDVGFGISQLLPIVVQALVGADSTICVEQPEIHVHPRLQAEMADLFVEAVTARRGCQLIIETHSEHLMLRIQNLVRDGEIDADDVAVLYVDSDSAGSASVVRLRLNDGGQFLDDWPGGFFEERFEELFRVE
jgi:AAA ATPase domain/Protein of unknown function (DUF3696)